MVARHAVEQPRQHAELGAGAGAVDCRRDGRGPRLRLAQPHRSHHEPWHQLDVLAQLLRAFGQRDGFADGGDPVLARAREHERHAAGDGYEETRLLRGARLQELFGSLRGPLHGARVAGEEAGVHALGEHRHRQIRVAVGHSLRGADEDRVPLHHRPAPRRDAAPQVLDGDGLLAIGPERLRLVEQRERALAEARRPRRLGGVEEQRSTSRLPLGEPRCALEGERRHRVGAARARPRRRLLEGGGGALVGAEGRHRQVPRAAIGVAVGKRVGERPVCRPALVGRRLPVDGGTRERVAELRATAGHAHEPRLLRRRQVRHLEPERARRPLDRRDLPGVARRDEHEQAPHGLIERFGAPRERTRDRVRHRQGRVDRRGAEARSVAAELDQRERVAARGGVHTVAERTRHRRQQRRGGLAVEPRERDRRQIRCVEQRGLALADREQRSDRLRQQAPQREQQRLGARGVEQVRVVDEQQRRRLLGVCREQAERRRSNREAVAGATGAQRERDLERRRLRRGDAREQPQRRAYQLEQRRERDACLGLDAARPQHAQSGGVLLGVTEQRRLADAGLADEREHRAVPRTGGREQSVELPPLWITPEQHALILGPLIRGARGALTTRWGT